MGTRAKTLGANERIKIGETYTMGNDEKVLARVLRSVGLLLEVDVRKEHFVMYAVRRTITHDVEVPPEAAKAKPAAEKIP